MTKHSQAIQTILRNLRLLRESAGKQQSELEKALILGPGWINRFEKGETVPSLDMLLAIAHTLGGSVEDLFKGIMSEPEPLEIERQIYAEERDAGLLVQFKYNNFDAEYTLANATIDEFESVITTLKDGLAHINEVGSSEQKEAIKTDAVAKAFLKAVQLWPNANPSDLWWFIVYRAYCDPFNHPASYARLDFPQSWKRTGGWALEEVLVRHYAPFLKQHGINLFIGSTSQKHEILKKVKVKERLEADKIDVILTGRKDGEELFFGVVHVKASFAERRTDDVPMSKALVEAGYCSPLWTMDCKSTPANKPVNRGELGVTLQAEKDSRSAKRKDIEEDAYFSACFSYNRNTAPTPLGQNAKARIFSCDFKSADDAFSQFILTAWQRFCSA